MEQRVIQNAVSVFCYNLQILLYHRTITGEKQSLHDTVAILAFTHVV